MPYLQNFEKLANGTVLGQSSPNSCGIKYAKNHKM